MERWKPVDGFVGKYEVSSMGRVRNSRTGHVLKPMRTGSKRASAQRSTVRFSTNPRLDFAVAHLVLEAFVGPKPPGMVAMHADDDTTNNAVRNLRWGTHGDNAQDCAAKGRFYNQKLSSDQMDQIIERRRAGESGVALAQEFNVSQQRVCDVFKGRSHKKTPTPCDAGEFKFSLTKGKQWQLEVAHRSKPI